jgi:hypothetical protein
MSDCKMIYSKVKEFLECLYPDQLSGNLARNMNTLTAMITGIIIGKESQLPQIAANVPEMIKLASTEKRFKRLIINEKVTEQTYFLPFVESVLRTLGLQEITLAIDGSLVGRGCICLMISLIYKRRALPIAFTVFKGKKGHLPENEHIELVKKIQPLIPESTRQVVFLGDGEFDGTDLQKTLNDFDWKYVCRTSSNITIYAGDEPFQIDTLAAMLPKGCYKRLRNKLRINNTVLLQLLLGGAMIKKSHCFLLPISLLDRKPVITTQSALPSKRFSAIRKAVGSTSIKAIYLARSD